MYFYEHENGTIHSKPDIVVDMGGGPGKYFYSPFVKNWWYEKTKENDDLDVDKDTE